MSQRDLQVQSREETGKEAAKRLRRAGSVPAIAYGHKEEPVKLSVNAKQLRDMLSHGGSHGLVTLKFEGGSSSDVPVVIKSLQKHPVTHAVSSVDFLRVSLDEKVKTTIPIVLEGEPEGVKVDGGILVQALHEIEVESVPQKTPEHITVDVSGLVFNGAPIHVSEITMPEGVTAITPGETSIAVVNPPDVEPIVEEPVDPSAIPAIEVSDEEVTTEASNES
ncbi:MAG TPA: 50S ribosomal protein L25 [Abditibacteriaceae bacterium]